MKFEFVGGENIVVQTGVLHGALVSCTNADFPAIFNRVGSEATYKWIMDQVFDTGKTRKYQRREMNFASCLLQI